MRALRPVFESMPDLSRSAPRAGVAARANSSGQSRRRRTHRAQRPFQRTHLSLPALPRLRDSVSVRRAVWSDRRNRARAAWPARLAFRARGTEFRFHPLAALSRGGCVLSSVCCVSTNGADCSGSRERSCRLNCAKWIRCCRPSRPNFFMPKRMSCPPSARAALKSPCSMDASCRSYSATSMKPPCACSDATAAMSYCRKSRSAAAL